MTAVPIAWVNYDCDGRGADVGLCLTDGRDRKHHFDRYPPLLDMDTMQVIGPVRVVGNGIHDWPGGVPPAPGPATRRIGKLDSFILSTGQLVDFSSVPFGLYTDNQGTALYAVAENPGPELEGFRALNGSADLERAIAAESTTAVLYLARDCENCAAARPTFPKIREHFPRSFAFDVDTDLELTRKHGVREIPAMVLYRSGKSVATIKYLERVTTRLDACRSKILGAPA